MDTIANLLTIIRNGYMAKKESVTAPYSKFSESILGILVKNEYISDFKKTELGKKREFEIRLKYHNRQPVMTGIVKVSKPGRRIYRRANNLPKSLSGFGITIISTSAGVMTEKEAQRLKLGGEVICQVW